VTDEELDRTLHEMRANDVHIIEAIKFVRIEQNIDLGQAKQIVSVHPAYADVHRAAEALHDELIGYVDALSDDTELQGG
jgi:hypothetical protein